MLVFLLPRGDFLPGHSLGVLAQFPKTTHGDAHAIVDDTVVAIATMEVHKCQGYTNTPPKGHDNLLAIKVAIVPRSSTSFITEGYAASASC
jgi:hypothetical protein